MKTNGKNVLNLKEEGKKGKIKEGVISVFKTTENNE